MVIMSFELRVGLLELQKIARTAIRDDDRPNVEKALDWIEDQLAEDTKKQNIEQRSREWAAAGRCSRCGDDDPACICYTR